jgi:hypothetical protein
MQACSLSSRQFLNLLDSLRIADWHATRAFRLFSVVQGLRLPKTLTSTAGDDGSVKLPSRVCWFNGRKSWNVRVNARLKTY